MTTHIDSGAGRAILLALLFFPALALARGSETRHVDIAREQVSKLDDGMTSMDIAIYGVRLGMSWNEARALLMASDIPFRFAGTVPTTVYFGPSLSTFTLTLNPSSFEIIEMGIENDADLPRPNRYLANGSYWRLTTARMYFFGSEGHFTVNEEDTQFTYPRLGFALRCTDCQGFRFVMVRLPSPNRSAPLSLPPPHIIEKFEIDVPFFVTGYWKPNTTENLADLAAARRSGVFKTARFIDTRDADYDSLALLVDATLERGTQFIENTLLQLRPTFDQVASVTIVVRGFADSKQQVAGRYVGVEGEHPSRATARGAHRV